MMLDFQQKRKFRGFLYNRITIGVIFVILVIVMHSTWVVYRKKVESEQMKNISLKNVSDLQNRSNDLQYKIDRLSTKQGLEEEVRLKFSVVKENENMVVIVQDKPTTSIEIKKDGFWLSFLKSIGL